MIIGYDGKRAARNLTGLGNYSRMVITAVAKGCRGARLLVYAAKIRGGSARIKSFFAQECVTWRKPRNNGLLWRSAGIVKDLLSDGVQVYHGLSAELPWGIKRSGIKTVLTVHDLIFLVHPQNYRWADRLIYNIKCRYACRNADRIIAISERTREDIIRYYDVNPAKIEVQYQGCDAQFKLPVTSAVIELVRRKYKLPARYILYVGTIEARKNLIRAVEALVHLPQDVTLVCIGGKTAYYKQVMQTVHELGMEARVVFLENVPFTDFPAVYKAAEVLTLPSYYEGFGIPVLEAITVGTPVVAATGSCLEEAGGPGSMYVDPDDAKALAAALNEVLENNDIRDKMISEGRIYAEKFNADEIAEKLWNTYNSVLYAG